MFETIKYIGWLIFENHYQWRLAVIGSGDKNISAIKGSHHLVRSSLKVLTTKLE